MRLFIIGNGFDIAHNLPTKYDHFDSYMKTHHRCDYERIGRMFSNNQSIKLWMDFENNLSNLNIVGLCQRNFSQWQDYDPKNDKKYYELENVFYKLYEDINWHFTDWIHDTLKDLKTRELFDLSKEDLYITFNYTETLEAVYHIPSLRILHIHGNCVGNELRKPIFGHGMQDIDGYIQRNYSQIANIAQTQYPDNWINMVSGFKRGISSILYDLQKKTDDVIEENKSFFGKIACNKTNISNIYVLGHSLSDVDMPYFRKVHCILPDANWHIDYFPIDDNVRDQKLNRFRNAMGFDAESICKL